MKNQQTLLKKGDKLGNLTVIALEKVDKNGKRHYLFSCDCGNTYTAIASNLKNRVHKHCKACTRKSSRVGICNRLPNNLGIKRDIINAYKQSAKRRNLEYNLTEEHILKLISQNCEYCGASPSSVMKAKRTCHKRELVYNGIDRIDNSKGYLPNNVVTCCPTCNTAKLKMSRDEFLNWIKKVFQHSIYGKN